MDEKECLVKGGIWQDNVCTIKESAKDKITNKIKTSYTPSKEGKPFILGFIIAFGIIFTGIATGPFFPLPIAVIISLLFFIISMKKGWFKKPTISDIFLSILVIAGYVIFGLVLGLIAIAHIPITKLLLAGGICDAISIVMALPKVAAYTAGGLPGLVMGFILGIIKFFIVLSIVGGIWGTILGTIALLIAISPFPLTLITFIVIKIILSILF